MKASITPQELPVSTKKTFTYLQAMALIVLSAVTFIGSGYAVGKYFFWTGEDKAHLAQQLEHYKQVVANDPTNLENKVALGYAYFLNNDSENAILTFKTVLDVNKDYYDAYLNLGIVYIEEGQYNEALKALDKAVKISPYDYKGYLNLGIAHYKAGKYDLAIETLNKALQVNRGGADIYYHQGVAFELAGQKDIAIDAYNDALKYNPNYEEAKEAIKKLQKK